MRNNDIQLINTWHESGQLFDTNDRISIASVLRAAEDNPTLADIMQIEDPAELMRDRAAIDVITSITDSDGHRLYYLDRNKRYREFANVHGDRTAYRLGLLSKILESYVKADDNPEVTAALIKVVKVINKVNN